MALLAKERRELAEDPEEELAELAGLYVDKGLSEELALQVARELTAHDALGAHAEAELGIDPDDLTSPWQAAWASMLAFTRRRAAAAADDHADAAERPGLGDRGRRGGRARRHRLDQRPARLRPAAPAVLRNVAGGAFAMAVTYGIGTLLGASVGCSRMRMFVALRPPDEAVEHLDEFLAVRREAAAFRWTPAEQLHVTLAFLAEVPGPAARRPGRAAGAGRAPADARADPDRRRRRVPERGPGPGAVGRAATLDDARPDRARPDGDRRPGRGDARPGIEVDGQRFRPHLTVARLGRPDRGASWVRLLDAYAGPDVERDRRSRWWRRTSARGRADRPRHEVVEELRGGRESPRARGEMPVRTAGCPLGSAP